MNKEKIISGISDSIVKDVFVTKMANEILLPIEKEAASQSGIGAFGRALLGTDKRVLSAQKGRLAEELIKKTKDPRILEAKHLVSKAEEFASNADLHPRMKAVKEGYEGAVKKYQDTASKNDDVINSFIGSKAPLKVVSPSWYGAKAKNFGAKIKLNDAKKQYTGQRKRISEDIMKEVDLAKQNVKDLEKKHDISKLQAELNSVTQMHDHASAKTRSARTVAGGTALVGYGAYKVNKVKKDKENQTGPYMYSNASEKEQLIEKMAEEILNGGV